MKTIRLLVMVAAGIALVVSLIWSLLTRMPAAARSKARKLLAEADWLGASSQAGQLVKMTGVVRTRDAAERLMSPVSNVRCVALRLRAQPRRGLDPRSKLVEKTELKAFDLEDAEGKVAIEPAEVLFDLAPIKQGKPDAGVRAKVLADLGHPEADSTKSNVEETVLEVGSTVTIAGKLEIVDGKHRLVGTIACAAERRLSLAKEP